MSAMPNHPTKRIDNLYRFCLPRAVWIAHLTLQSPLQLCNNIAYTAVYITFVTVLYCICYCVYWFTYVYIL